MPCNWFLIGVGYQKSTYNEAVSILNYLLNGSVSILSMLLPAVIFIVIFKLKPTNIIVTEQVKPAVGISFLFIGRLFVYWPTFRPTGYLLC